MRIFAVDPGAERCGIAILNDDPLYRIDSTIFSVPRLNRVYQEYRLYLINTWTFLAMGLLQSYKPDVLISETVPIKGGNFGAMAQMNLAATVISVLQTIAFYARIQVEQIAAQTVKLKIGGKKDASKVKVRNGVYHFLPETKTLTENNWSKVFDESDAHAIGLAYLGYDIRKIDGNNKKEGSVIRTSTITQNS